MRVEFISDKQHRRLDSVAVIDTNENVLVVRFNDSTVERFLISDGRIHIDSCENYDHFVVKP